MDVAVKVGLVDVGLAAASELPVSFSGAEPATAAEHCPATVLATGGSTGSTTVGHQTTVPTTTVNAPAALATAQVVIITRAAIMLSGTPASPMSGSAAAAAPAKEIVKLDAAGKGSGPIDELAKALPKPASADVPLILQADQETSAMVITRVIATAKAAGYDNVLFAVKNK
jgi:biopolymer transport protein ExbD